MARKSYLRKNEWLSEKIFFGSGNRNSVYVMHTETASTEGSRSAEANSNPN